MERELPTAPKLQEAINTLNSIAEKMLGDKLKMVACSTILDMTPSKRSTFIYKYTTNNDVWDYIKCPENNHASYIITGDTLDIEVDEEYISGDFKVEPMHLSNYIYSGYFTYTERKDGNHEAIKSIYGNLDIRLVLDFIVEIPFMLKILVEHKFKASKISSMHIMRSLTIYMRLLEIYKNFYVALPIMTKLTGGELYFNKRKMDAVEQVAPSKFVVKLKENDLSISKSDFKQPNEFVSFRLLDKMFETFNIKQFDIDISEICSNISPLIYFKMTVIKDISLDYNGFNIYSEMASIGVSAHDEWWDVKTPVVIIQYGSEDIILLTKVKEKIIVKFLKGYDEFNLVDDDETKRPATEEDNNAIAETITDMFKYVLEIFNERIHEFFRLNDKGIGTFDVEITDNSSNETHSRHFTPKKTVVKGHIRHYKSGAIAYVLPHVRCYEGGEDSIVTLNLK